MSKKIEEMSRRELQRAKLAAEIEILKAKRDRLGGDVDDIGKVCENCKWGDDQPPDICDNCIGSNQWESPEGVEKPDPPPVPPIGVFHLGPGEMVPFPDPPPLFNNPTAQRAYEYLMADARRREKDLQSTSLSPNDVHQFMLEAHARAIRTAYELSIDGIRAINDIAEEIKPGEEE